jgi:hypothetical protein
MFSTQNQVDLEAGLKQLVDDEGYAYAAGYMGSMMKEMLNLLPKRKQKEFLQQLQARNDNFQVEVQSLGNGAMVKIRRKDRGGPSDPSTERHWSM